MWTQSSWPLDMHAVGGCPVYYSSHRIMRALFVPCSCCGECPYCGLVRMLARAVDDLYLSSPTSELCFTTEVHSMNNYWGCGKVFH